MWMSRKTTRIIAVIIVIIFLLGTIFMAASSFAATEEISGKITEAVISKVELVSDKTMEFSLDQAKKYAKENNYDLKIAALEKTNIDISKKMAKTAQSNLESLYDAMKKLDSFSDAFDSYKARNGYIVKASSNGVKLTELVNQLKQKATEVSVETAYYTLSENTLIYQLKHKTLSQIKDEVKLAEEKLTLGNISEIEYKSILIKKYAAEMNYESAKADYKKALMEFNRILNLPLEQEVKLTSQVGYNKYEIPNYEEKISKIKAENVEYNQLILNKELQQLEHRLTKSFYGSSANEFKILSNKLSITDIEIKKKEIAIEMTLKNDINTITSMETTLNTSKESVILSNTALDITKLRRTLGMATEIDVVDAEIKAQDAQIGYIKALHGYSILTTVFENNVK